MFLWQNFYFQGIIMKIDQIVYVPGRGHIVCVQSFGEHVFKVGDKVTLTSSEEIGLKKKRCSLHRFHPLKGRV